MRRVVLFMLLAFIVAACNKFFDMVRASGRETYHYHNNGLQDFRLDNGLITLDVLINRKNREMIFDTRAVSMLFSNAENSWVDSLDVVVEFGKLKSANNLEIKNHVTAVDRIETDIFSIDHKLMRVIGWNSGCSSSAGILGMDVFDLKKQVVKLDFDKQGVQLLSGKGWGEGWHEIKSRFGNGYIKIQMNLDGRRFWFGLDTGFSGSLIVNKTRKNSVFLNSLRFERMHYGTLFQSASGGIEDTLITRKLDRVFLADSIYLEDVLVNTSSVVESNLVGTGFLKNFNLILDYKDKKVYVQKRRIIPEKKSEPLLNFGAGVMLSGEQLIIAYLTSNGIAEATGFQIHDILVEINGIVLDNQHPCDKKHTFEKSLNYSGLNTMVVKRNGERLEKNFVLCNQ